MTLSHGIIVLKYKNDMHVLAALQKPFTLFDFWTIKIKNSRTNLFKGFLK